MSAVAASARATSARLGVDPARHRWLACLPLSHIGGLSVVTRSLLTGTPLTVLDGFDAGQVLPRPVTTCSSPRADGAGAGEGRPLSTRSYWAGRRPPLRCPRTW